MPSCSTLPPAVTVTDPWGILNSPVSIPSSADDDLYLPTILNLFF